MRSKLSEMNPFAKVEADSTMSIEDLLSGKKSLQRYAAVVYGFRNFKEAEEINEIARKLNIPFYCLNSSGLCGFFYVDLGTELQFSTRDREKEKDISFVI